MMNEHRVRLMTRMAIYEKNEGAADEKTHSYFRLDYIMNQVLHTFICVTAAYALIAFAWCFYNFEELMLSVYSMDLEAMAFRVVMIYAILLAVFVVITIFVYVYRYHNARKHLERYYQDLRRLSASYQREEEE